MRSDEVNPVSMFSVKVKNFNFWKTSLRYQ
jgi:hypothetical protein